VQLLYRVDPTNNDGKIDYCYYTPASPIGITHTGCDRACGKAQEQQTSHDHDERNDNDA
jgi:hypothetical protein